MAFLYQKKQTNKKTEFRAVYIHIVKIQDPFGQVIELWYQFFLNTQYSNRNKENEINNLNH